MIFEGDKGVIDAIKEKKQLRDAGQAHEHINVMCIVDGGLMKGVYGVGAGLAFSEAGYYDIFDTIVGISAGAPSAAYFLAQQAEIGGSLIYEECCSKKFMNFWRFNNMLDTQYIVDTIFNKEEKKLDVESVLRYKKRLRIGLADYETAECTLLQPETAHELRESMRASMSMPGLVKQKIFIRGRRYLDGASAVPHPLEVALQTIPATHVLIFTNQDKDTTDIPWLEKLLNKTILRLRFSPALLKAVNNRRIARHSFVEKILHGYTDMPVCLIWGDGSIGSFERDPQKVKAVVEKSRQWWKKLLT